MYKQHFEKKGTGIYIHTLAKYQMDLDPKMDEVPARVYIPVKRASRND